MVSFGLELLLGLGIALETALIYPTDCYGITVDSIMAAHLATRPVV